MDAITPQLNDALNALARERPEKPLQALASLLAAAAAAQPPAAAQPAAVAPAAEAARPAFDEAEDLKKKQEDLARKDSSRPGLPSRHAASCGAHLPHIATPRNRNSKRAGNKLRRDVTLGRSCPGLECSAQRSGQASPAKPRRRQSSGRGTRRSKSPKCICYLCLKRGNKRVQACIAQARA